MIKNNIRIDMGLLIAVLLIMGFGIVLVYSSSFVIGITKYKSAEYFFTRHMIRIFISIIALAIFSNIDYHVWCKLGNLAFLISLVLLVAVLIAPEQRVVKGAKRWLSIGDFSFQVSEVARIGMIIFLARELEKMGPKINEIKQYLKLIFKIGIISFLILIEPNFSTAAITILIGMTILFVAGFNFFYFIGTMLTIVPIMVLAALKMPHSKARIFKFLKGIKNISELGYQAYQSIIGLGHGGIFGTGIGKGDQKYFFLPEPHTDFALSILGEELGFIGIVSIIAIFSFIVYKGISIALKSPDRSGQLMAFGFTFTIAIYVLFHSAVAVGLLPTTGIPLPFISYGGMSLIFMCISIGIILNISSQSKERVTSSTTGKFYVKKLKR